jgi:hypothetical protein
MKFHIQYTVQAPIEMAYDFLYSAGLLAVLLFRLFQ